MPFRRLIAPLLILAAGLACGGGGGDIRWGGGATGTLVVRLGSDSFPGYDQAVVSLEKVEGTLDGSTWTPLGTVQATYDLMALQNGNSTVILPAASVPAGTYSQFRLTWATKNYANPINLAAYVVPTGAATGQPMGMPTTTILPGPVTVPSGGSATAQLMLSGQQAVQARPGTSPYTFQPTGQAFDTTKVASIAGKLLDGTTPLAGTEVFAETLDGSLTVPTIQRRAFTDAAGNYLLEALPASTNTAYYVVAQPGNAVATYAAQAATPVIVTSASAYTANLAFSGPTAPGALTLTLTPASTATQGTWGELRQTLPTGTSGAAILIIRSQTAASGLSQDQVYFTALPPGIYGVAAQRSTSGAAPVTVKAATTQAVTAGATTTTTLSY
ncbi:hypothetical protein GETHPA_09520 [Geothrix rubra]|uniref:DUF4382 domain-containing protein n=1 Tax=Geothrix rubra TaxID=2927977 RepID=A0ABQ5Q4Y1_9BACT|nr:DUF4382 domain-containing protein [Geothrix rubra]GLH69419.1 hypothetical protein GETHPA_09520 [Geothrix rubra]